MIVPDIGDVGKPFQVLGHRAETDKEAAEQKNWYRQHGTQKHRRLNKQQQHRHFKHEIL